MQVQLFRFARQKRRGPFGVYEEDTFTDVGAGAISDGEHQYNPDESGFVEVPRELGERLVSSVIHDTAARCTYRYLTPGEVDENVRLGMQEKIAAREEEPVAEAKAPRRNTKTAKSDDGSRPDDGLTNGS